VLPSLFASKERAQPWNVPRAAAAGAAVGLAAALFRTLGPLHAHGFHTAAVVETVGAVVGFALLCAVAALLRNLVARKLIWPDLH